MKVLVVNCTKSEGHHGCSRVYENTNINLKKRGADKILYIPTEEDPLTEQHKPKFEAADVVIVNGEGSIHHGRKKAKSLLQVGKLAKSLGKKSFLINSTIQGNPVSYYENLRDFDKIFVRDSFTKRHISKYHDDIKVVPDISFWSESINTGARDNIGFVCNVSTDITLQLYKTSKRNNYKMVSVFETDTLSDDIISKSMIGKKDLIFKPLKVLRVKEYLNNVSTVESHDLFSHWIASKELLVTGRYHALCFSINNLTPFLVTESNSFKVQGLLYDIFGDDYSNRILKGGRFKELDKISCKALVQELKFSQKEIKKLDRFLVEGKKSIEDMFDIIMSSSV